MSLEVEEEHRVAELRAVAHPLRLQMLSLLTGAAMSATELSRELGVSQALASYHLRRLSDVGLVVLAERRTRRGGRERRYRLSPIGTTWRPGVRDEQSDALMVQAMVDQLRQRRPQRDPDEPGLVVDAELWVDPQDWALARAAVAQAALRLHERARPPREPGTVRVAATVLLFAMTARPPAPPEGAPS